ncbi:MAG TPA: CocE/NonD family hydrolase [Blastocatellia bacterium]|nr:CocE/NonD family hydrolase [Blastocatellia bacterium]
MKTAVLLLLLAGAIPGAETNPFDAPDPVPGFTEIQVRSLYLPMKDGVRIALDVLTPQGLPAGKKIPAILKITRYGRASPNGGIDFIDRFWVRRGFARVLIDQRGTGASFGAVRYGRATLDDMREVVDWVVKQPWANGRVGAIGDSYEGTTAELLAATGHPAVRAVAPNFSDYNYYTDLIRPGGVFNDWFTKRWQYQTAEMDKGRAAKRVDEDHDGSLMKRAIAEHKANVDVYEAAKQAEFVDDSFSGSGTSWSDIGIGGVSQELSQTRVPMLVFSSWLDAATAQGTLRRFQKFSNVQRVFIGDFGHGGFANANPFAPPDSLPNPTPHQQLLEALRFFQHYLVDPPNDGKGPERRLFYFTAGENTWNSTESWPPSGLDAVTYHLRADHVLGTQGAGNFSVKFAETSTGEKNRWHTQETGGPVDYDPAVEHMRQLPAFTTEPIATAIEITGQPVLHLKMQCPRADPSVFAYLMALDPEGKEKVLTEGQLRLLHRKLNTSEQTLHTYARADALPVVPGQEIEAVVTLLPLSVVLPKGDRLRLLLASNDTSVFAGSAAYEATMLPSSYIELPEKQRPGYTPPTVASEQRVENPGLGAEQSTITYVGLLQGLLRIRVTLHRVSNQSWTGSFVSLDDSGLERQLDDVIFKPGGEMRFSFKVPRPTSYHGHVSTDGSQIRGTLSQGGASAPLALDMEVPGSRPQK